MSKNVPPDGRGPLPAGWEFQYAADGRMFFTRAPNAPPSYHSVSAPAAPAGGGMGYRPPPTAPSVPQQPYGAAGAQQSSHHPPYGAPHSAPYTSEPTAQYPAPPQATASRPSFSQAYPPAAQAYPAPAAAQPPATGGYPAHHAPPPHGYPASAGHSQQAPSHGHRQPVRHNTAEKRQAALHAFAQYDADRSGHIDINEFYRALLSLGLQVSWEDSCTIFGIIDNDRNGYVCKEEFVQHYLANH